MDLKKKSRSALAVQYVWI